MKPQHTHRPLLLVIAAAALTACMSITPSAPPGGPQDAPAPAVGRTGAELWSEICSRCHNYRSPASLSDAQWDVAVHHMRVRANLTGEEQRKITEFLKSAN